MLKSRVLELNASDDRGIQVSTICIAYIHMYVHVFTYMCTYTYMDMYIQTYVYTSNIYIHTCMYI